ncbi:hypothetical protein BDV23DRAFT_63443 [Aspergillus alliaceus]|uniref:Uncharacterized protein n=1 Tax=Petromyces alliaceus TaxID=209559 RepID=A0A5N7CD37_PETAA|nr:hypothetical protein BDV23DRAFT_63443 [Aspergillus alliaceus]
MKDDGLEITFNAGSYPSLQQPEKETDGRPQHLDKSEDPTNWPLWRKWSIVTHMAVMYMLANLNHHYRPGCTAHFVVCSRLREVLSAVSCVHLGTGRRRRLIHGRTTIGALRAQYYLLRGLPLLQRHGSYFSYLLPSPPSIIGDLFVPEERGAAMALGITLPLIGPCVAPVRHERPWLAMGHLDHGYCRR